MQSSSEMANALRALAMDSVEKAKSGHPGLPLGAADFVTVLFTQMLKFDISDTHWPDRDRFVLSAGHGSMLLYALLYLLGEEEMTLDQLRSFRQLGSKTPGHPEVHHTKGVEVTTGPLGQGLATAVGMALGERMLHAEFGEVVDHYTYVLASDGDLMEGISQEAIALAGHLKLSRLIVLYDDNQISIDGPTSLSDSVDQILRFHACGWNAHRLDGHNPAEVLAHLQQAKNSDKPTLLACRTTIGFGSPNRAGTSKVHGEPLGAEEIAATRQALNWPHPPFVIPEKILQAWRQVGRRGQADHKAWQEKVAALPPSKRAEFERRLKGELPSHLDQSLQAFKKEIVRQPQACATRKASESVLRHIAPLLPELILGSADLTPSNNNKVEATSSIGPGSYNGRFIHWGVREHGMAAAVNGLRLHGGFIPSGATFLAFTDYCRPALRLAALMQLQTIHIMTHDSIGLGEDGPTHQPVEHLAALRAIPHLLVLRPADLTETLECWEIALKAKDRPSILALSRQSLPVARKEFLSLNRCSEGAYELAPSPMPDPQVSLFASGSEVSLALEAQAQLLALHISSRVVSVPCLDIFLERPEKERKAVIGTAPLRVGIEAGLRQGWEGLIGETGLFIGMDRFGASAPSQDLYTYFNITTSSIVAAIRTRLGY